MAELIPTFQPNIKFQWQFLIVISGFWLVKILFWKFGTSKKEKKKKTERKKNEEKKKKKEEIIKS